VCLLVIPWPASRLILSCFFCRFYRHWTCVLDSSAPFRRQGRCRRYWFSINFGPDGARAVAENEGWSSVSSISPLAVGAGDRGLLMTRRWKECSFLAQRWRWVSGRIEFEGGSVYILSRADRGKRSFWSGSEFEKNSGLGNMACGRKRCRAARTGAHPVKISNTRVFTRSLFLSAVQRYWRDVMRPTLPLGRCVEERGQIPCSRCLVSTFLSNFSLISLAGLRQNLTGLGFGTRSSAKVEVKMANPSSSSEQAPSALRPPFLEGGRDPGGRTVRSAFILGPGLPAQNTCRLFGIFDPGRWIVLCGPRKNGGCRPVGTHAPSHPGRRFVDGDLIVRTSERNMIAHSRRWRETSATVTRNLAAGDRWQPKQSVPWPSELRYRARTADRGISLGRAANSSLAPWTPDMGVFAPCRDSKKHGRGEAGIASAEDDDAFGCRLDGPKVCVHGHERDIRPCRRSCFMIFVPFYRTSRRFLRLISNTIRRSPQRHLSARRHRYMPASLGNSIGTSIIWAARTSF